MGNKSRGKKYEFCHGLKESTLVGRGSEEPLDEFPVYDAVINGQHMKLRLCCGHPHWRKVG